MENVNRLAVEIREIGKANGWNIVYHPDWDSSEDMIPSRLALIHSEIDEAYIEKHVGDMDALAAEFADIAIRVLDLAGGLTAHFDAHLARIEGALISEDIEMAFNSLHQITTYALEAFRSGNLLKFLGALALLVFSVECFAKRRFDIDLNVAVLEKMEVNRHRPQRHGGKRV